jgi:Bax protein
MPPLFNLRPEKDMNTWKLLAVIPFLLMTLAMVLVPVEESGSFVSKLTPDEQVTGFSATELVATEEISIAEPELAITAEVSVYHPNSVKLGQANGYSPPDFSKIGIASQRKEAFYDYLLPMVHKANAEVLLERQWLLSMADKLTLQQSLSAIELEELTKVEGRYRLSAGDKQPAKRVNSLLLRVDVVPASLTVAQAAKESGWGTSRFATEGNNFFGIWCFYQGCGLTPLRRRDGLAHEVGTFDTVEEGVRYYIRTINTHVAYNHLRELRAEGRRQNQFQLGEVLANGLISYSERGMAYVREVQTMIRYNKLHRFTRIYRA